MEKLECKLPGTFEEKVLKVLFDHPGLTASELVREIRTNSKDTSHIVNRLRKKNLITRDDWKLFLTQSGHEVLDRLREGWVIRWTRTPHFVKEYHTTCPSCQKKTVMVAQHGQENDLWECQRCGIKLRRIV